MPDFKAFEKILLDEEELLGQVKSERDSGISYCEGVREALQVDYNLYKNVKTNPDLIGDSTLANAHHSLMARSYLDRPMAHFSPTTTGMDDVVANLNSVYKEDYDEQDYAIVKYYVEFFKYLFGVGIVARTGWDGNEKRNIYKWVDPRIWVPDPNGDYLTGDYQFTGFEKVFHKDELLSIGVTEHEIEELAANRSELNGAKDRLDQDRSRVGLSPDYGGNQDNPFYELYWHYTSIVCKDGKVRKFRLLVDTACTEILKFDEVEPITKSERKDPSLIKFPFTFFYFRPEPGNPYGARVGDFTRDVQKAKAEMQNLRHQKSKAELYPMYLYNQRYVKNRGDLAFGFNKNIAIDTGADGAVNLDAIVRPLTRDFRADWSFQIEQSLDRQVEGGLSVNAVMQGMTPEERDSATRDNLIQSNSDINLNLDKKAHNFGERAFVKDWLRGYIENFTDADKKIAVLATGLGQLPVTLSRKDFLVEDNLKITVLSTGEIEAQKRKEQQAINAIVPLLSADPNMDKAAKNHLLRLYARVNGMEEKDIAISLHDTPDEMLAKDENLMLRDNKWVNVNPTDDDLQHMAVHKAAGNTEATLAHVRAHIDAYIAKGKPMPQAPEAGGVEKEVASAAVAQQSSSIGANAAQIQNLPLVTQPGL